MEELYNNLLTIKKGLRRKGNVIYDPNVYWYGTLASRWAPRLELIEWRKLCLFNIRFGKRLLTKVKNILPPDWEIVDVDLGYPESCNKGSLHQSESYIKIREEALTIVREEVEAKLPETLSLYRIADGSVEHPTWKLTLEVMATPDQKVYIDWNDHARPWFTVYYDELDQWLEAWNKLMELSRFSIEDPML